MRLQQTLWASLLLVAPLAIAPALAQTGTKPQAAEASKPVTTAAASASPALTSAVSPAPRVATSAQPAAGAQAPVPAPTPGAAAHGAAAVPPGGMDGATYAVKLRDLEQRVDELKDQIRRSHTRLSLLTDTILSGGVGGSRADIQFQNDMSNAFRLTRALFVLDGAVQYNKTDDTGALADQPVIPIFTGNVPPGDHTLQVLLQYQGNGYGVFSYLKGYRFDARSSHSFTAVEGKTLSLQIVAYEKGGVTVPLEQRPAIRFAEKLSVGSGPASSATPAAKPPAGVSASGSFSLGTGGK